jgi:hypothetical protein
MKNPFVAPIVAQIDNPRLPSADFKHLLWEFTQSLKDCPKAEADDALVRLVPVLASKNVSRASWVAEVCRAMVESGCSAAVVARPLARGLKRALRATRPLADKLERKLAPKLVDLEDPEKARRWTESAIRQLAVKLPQAVASLRTAERFCQAAFTVYGRHVSCRPKAWRYLQESLTPIAPWSVPIGDLQVLLQLLENEPIVVIDLAQRRGFVGTFGGVVDNQHLLTLLLDTYVRQLVFGKPLVSHDVAQCAQGIGPCRVSDNGVQGAWNVYTYKALNEKQMLPEPRDLKANKHWVWPDKTPEQIPCLDGFRVLLLGPPSYPRVWSFERKFQHVRAGIKVDRELTKLDLRAWLDRIHLANFPPTGVNAASAPVSN